MLAFMQSDRAVIRKVLQGNAGAFRVLVERYGGVVHGVAYARLRNTTDAEDIAQETFLRFYQQLDQMAHRKYIGPWLVRVARNVSVDLVRKHGRDCALAERQQGDGVEVPNPGREELHRILYEQLDGLDAESREVLILYYFKKKRAREIAALLEITPEAAAKRIQRARDELGRRLTDLLGEEVDEARSDARLTARIMAAVIASTAAWKASASGAAAATTALGVATGAGAAKVAAIVALIAAVAGLAYFSYAGHGQAAPPPDITSQSAITLENTASPKTGVANPKPPAVTASSPDLQPADFPADEPLFAPVYGAISGVVTMEDGTPAADADVWLDNQESVVRSAYAIRRGWSARRVKPLRFAAKTDSNGRYEIAGFPVFTMEEMSTLLVLHGEKSGQYNRANLGFSPLQLECVQDLVLHPCAALGGIVMGRDGKPVADVAVTLIETKAFWWPTMQPSGCETLTKGDGTFVFERAPAALCRVYVSTPGYLYYVSEWLEAGRTDYELQLDPGNLISGRVVDADTGEGVGNVAVNGMDSAKTRAGIVNGYFSGEADESGYFEITGCTPGTYGVEVLPKEGASSPFIPAERPTLITIGAEPMTGVQISMVRGATLRGLITDEETGSPAAPGMTVYAGNGYCQRHCKTGEDGRYEIAGLPPGEITVSVVPQHPNTRPTNRIEEKLTLAEGELEKTHDIRLPARNLFAGTVVDDLGERVPWAGVAALAEADYVQTSAVLADETGRWSFEPKARVHGDVKTLHFQAVSDDGYSAQTGPFQAGEFRSDIVLRIDRAGRLEGEVVTTAGRPFDFGGITALPDSADASLPGPANSSGHFSSALGSPMSAYKTFSMNKRLGKDGRFTYAQLRPGQYTLEIFSGQHSGDAIATARISIQAGQTTKARLVVDTAQLAAVEGRVTIKGRPGAGLRVRLEPEERETVTAADGSYAILDLAPMEYAVNLTTGDGVESAMTVRRKHCELAAGEVARVDFEIGGSGGVIEGYVTKNGTPQPGAEVVVGAVDAPRVFLFRATTDEQGHYRIDDVADGDYVVEADVLRLAQQKSEATVAGGQTTRLDFAFSIGGLKVTIAGLREGEKARVFVLPAEAYVAEWTAEALDALGEIVVDSEDLFTDGPLTFRGIEQGDYFAAAVALPAAAEFDAESVLTGRIATSDVFSVGEGGSAEVAVDIK